MKKILKILGFTILGIIVLLYAAFLFVLPKAVDLSPYKAELQKIVKEQSGLDLDYSGAEIVTAPLLGAGVKISGVTVKLPDGSLLFSASNIKTAVSLPHLLFFTLRVSDAEIDNPFVNAEILPSGEDYKIVKLIEDILNKKKQASFAQKIAAEENAGFDFSRIKIIVPNVKLNNFKILITDLSSKHYLDLHGENLVFGWFNGKNIKLKTNAELFSDKNKNIQFNIDINTFLPKPAPGLDPEDDPAEKIDFAFINPPAVYQNYDLKTDIDAKLRITKNKNGNINSFGHLNIENLTMKLSSIRLPKSYFRLKTFLSSIDFDTNIYTIEDENFKLSGKINYGLFPSADIKFNTDEIKFANLLELYKAVLESMNVKNELNKFKAEGSLKADCSFKTNFKKLASSGFIKAENGGLSVKNTGSIISKMNVNTVLDNNALNFDNSELYIGNSKVSIEGSVNETSYADVSINAENISLPLLFNAFAPKELKKSYDFKSGVLYFFAKVQGKMKEAVYTADTKLSDLDFSDKKNSFAVKNKLAVSNLKYDIKTKETASKLKNNNLKILFPKTNSSIRMPKIEAEFDDNNLFLERNIIYFNDKSAFTYSGSVYNYLSPKDIDFKLQGEINTDDLIKFIGKEMKPFFHSKGAVPVNMSFTGDKNNQMFFVQGSGSSSGYITPVDFNMLQNLKTSLQAKIIFKPGRIKIKDTGLFTAASIFDENMKETIVLNKIAGIDGTIEGDTVNLIKIDIPNNLNGKIYVMPKSNFNLDKGRLYLYGKTNNLLTRGGFAAKNILLPEIRTAINEFNLNFMGNELSFNLNNLKMTDSDLNIQGRLHPFISPLDIYDFNINSNYFKAEDAAETAKRASVFAPAAPNTNAKTDIPVSIHSGRVNMKKIASGNIQLDNTRTDITLSKNILSLKRLNTDIFKGKTTGGIFVNLQNMLVQTDLEGSGINAEKALLDAAGIKDSLSGSVSYTAKLLIDAAASDPEAQMKGISGDIDFKISDGQFGPFGRLENMILAENIRESQFFQTALGGIINSLATIDTTHFSELTGHVSLKEGIAELNPVTSSGNVMNMHILGKFDIIKNYADMKVRIKLASVISNLLGPLNAINPVNLVNSAASLNAVTAKAFSLFCETASEEEMNIMPSFSNSYVDFSASKFQLGVRGDAAKPLTLIKSFKWLASKKQIAEAQAFADSIPEFNEEGSADYTIKEAIEHAQAIEAEKKTWKYKIMHLFKKEDKRNDRKK